MLKDNIKNLRLKKGITKYQFAKISGISTSMMSKLELGKILDPKMSTLIALAKALDVTVNDLIK